MDSTEENGCLLAGRIATACIRQYRVLSKKGKPVVGEEWTPLAAVVLVDRHGQRKSCGQDQPSMTVVALGTGSKCIGQQRMCRRGWVVNDSHAEVLARRAFCRYLQGQIEESLRGSEHSVMARRGGGRVRLKEQYGFHFFATQPPCGDACIFPVDAGGRRTEQTAGSSGRGVWAEPSRVTEQPGQLGTVEDGAPCLLSQQRTALGDAVPSNTSDSVTNDSDTSHHDTSGTRDGDTSEVPDVPSAKRLKLSPPPSPPQPGDVHRTGARCTVWGEQDPHLPGAGYHAVGVLRTKPGRGDPTLSMACSDKMLRWNVLGCQGALLANLLECPIYFDSFTFLDTLFDEQAVRRALWERLSPIEEALARDGEMRGRGYRLNKPRLRVVKAGEVLSQEELLCLVPSESSKPTPGGVCWCVEPRCHDVIVQGVKQGASSRQEPSKSSAVFVCKARRLEDFKRMLGSLPDDCLPQCLQDRAASCSYRDCKRLDRAYCRARTLFLQFCPSWMESTGEFESFK